MEQEVNVFAAMKAKNRALLKSTFSQAQADAASKTGGSGGGWQTARADYFKYREADGSHLTKAAYNNVHQNITLISPLTAGLLNVIKVAPEVIETKCF